MNYYSMPSVRMSSRRTACGVQSVGVRDALALALASIAADAAALAAPLTSLATVAAVAAPLSCHNGGGRGSGCREAGSV